MACNMGRASKTLANIQAQCIKKVLENRNECLPILCTSYIDGGCKGTHTCGLVLVNDGVPYGITILEGNKEIHSKLLEWMHARQAKIRISKRNTKKKAKDSSNIDA